MSVSVPAFIYSEWTVLLVFAVLLGWAAVGNVKNTGSQLIRPTWLEQELSV